MPLNNLVIFLCGLLVALVAALDSTNDASTLCIHGCCGLKLPLDSPVLNLQSQVDSSPNPVAIAVSLSTPHLHCCPCPPLANTTVAAPADNATPVAVTPATLPAVDQDSSSTHQAPLKILHPVQHAVVQCPDWLCDITCRAHGWGCDQSCCSLPHLAKHMVTLSPAQLMAMANGTATSIKPPVEINQDSAKVGAQVVLGGKSEL